MKKQLGRLVLNQETLRSLNPEGGKVAAFFTQACPTGLTCPECNPPK
jgi:hypothetical protein